MTSHHIAQYIEHTLLQPQAISADFQKCVDEAIQHKFRGVCVPTSWLGFVTPQLLDHAILRVAVVGFPHGNQLSLAKAHEAELAKVLGAQEIDMVMHLGFFKEKNYERVIEDIQTVKKACDLPLKVIIESHLLSLDEVRIASELVVAGRADFVKTSTGFSGGGATLEAIQTMKKAVGNSIGIKASGGIKTSADAYQFLQAGATRLGTSRGVELVSASNNEGEGNGSISNRNY